MTSSALATYAQVMERLKSMFAGPAPSTAQDAHGKLRIAVVFTTVAATLAALREAATLADKLNARIELIVPQVVPFPAPLDTPPVAREFNEHRFRVMAREAVVDMDVRICLCRDRFQEIRWLLEPGSIVVLAGSQSYLWPDKDERLARRLQNAGYEVIFKKAE